MPNTDPIHAYYQRVAGEVRKAIAEQSYPQTLIAKECRERFGFDISQSTISKIVHGTGQVSMAYISAVCQILELDLNAVLSLNGDAPKTPARADFDGWLEADDIAGLIVNPKHRAFHGYIDREYDIYYLSTVSTSKTLITGTMTLSNEGDRYCKIHFQLNNNKYPLKEYFGRMTISVPLRACYCTVTSERLSEQCFFIFHHYFFSQGSLKARLAAVATVSAGGARRPTMQRMMICEKGTIDDDQKMEFITAQLRLNGSQIMVSEQDFKKLCQDAAHPELMQSLEARKHSLEPYYIFEESDIMKLPGYDKMTLVKVLARIREQSVSRRYNKVGFDADELLYQYLFGKFEGA